MAKERVLLGFSGGKDSALFAHQLQNKGHEVVGVTVNTGYLAPRAISNSIAIAQKLGIKHYVITDRQDRFVEIYREGCRKLRESYDPIRHFCHPCAEFVHEMVAAHAKDIGCPKIALGITDEDFELYDIPEGAFPGVIRPEPDGMSGDEKRAYLDDLGILSWKDSDPIKTNCRINFLMVDCCLRWYGKHPYEARFAHRKWLSRAVRWTSRFRLFRPLLLRRLRAELFRGVPPDCGIGE